MAKIYIIIAVVIILLILVGVGIWWYYGGKKTENITLTLRPKEASVAINKTVTLKGIVQGSEDNRVKWSINKPELGDIDSNGVFTAKASSGTVIITATSVADSSKKESSTIMLVETGGSTSDPCFGGEFKTCAKLGPTKSKKQYSPFEVMCNGGEYVDSITTASAMATNGIGVRCSGSNAEQYFGSHNDTTTSNIGWKNDRPPEGGYKRFRAFYGDKWDSVGQLSIYDKIGNEYSVGRQTDQPEVDMDCKDGTITGIYGSSNGDIINTIGVRCSYKS